MEVQENMTMKTSLLSFIKSRVWGRRTNKWLPSKLYPDDVFIVSYPRSGNTWVRFLIANLLKQGDEVIDFYTSNKYIPEVGRHDEIIQSLNRPRVMKSHAPYVRKYPRVIYVVRDGRDVYVSYYFYRLKHLPPGTTFKEFLKRRDHFPCLWGEHVSSWLFRKPSRQQILVVRYEDLACNCFEQLRRMADFIGLEAQEDQLRRAVEAASFENMRRLEFERGRPYRNDSPDVFVRKGQPGNWKEFFGPEEKAIFKPREGHVLIKLGYETDDNW